MPFFIFDLKTEFRLLARSFISAKMKDIQHKTKEEFARELGMSKSTLYRRIRAVNFKTSGELLSPAEQAELRMAFDDYKKRKTDLSSMKRIGTD
ncbi:MAG: hypothetical protein OHK0019_22520 [Saprospiraceae bacterium]